MVQKAKNKRNLLEVNKPLEIENVMDCAIMIKNSSTNKKL